jgi:hypothetical protein
VCATNCIRQLDTAMLRPGRFDCVIPVGGLDRKGRTTILEYYLSKLRHQGTYANLDSRGFGDIWTMTLKEYENSSSMKKIRYRLYRNPIVLVGLGALFYVQHQFEGGYWARKSEWEPLRAAMEGSSFYSLPTVLRWFSGNIGYHHIHHLNPMIPNYHLKKCYDSVPELQAKAPLTIVKSLNCYRLKLWDEDLREMIAFP